MTKTYTVKDQVGLHARPASILVKAASKHQNDIQISYKDKTMTLKSIIAVMSLGIPFGNEFSITVSGDNAESVLNDLETVMTDEKLI